MTKDYSKDIHEIEGGKGHSNLLAIPLTGKESANDLMDMWAALDAAPRPASWSKSEQEKD